MQEIIILLLLGIAVFTAGVFMLHPTNKYGSNILKSHEAKAIRSQTNSIMQILFVIAVLLVLITAL
jgi:hypothetical protein